MVEESDHTTQESQKKYNPVEEVPGSQAQGLRDFQSTAHEGKERVSKLSPAKVYELTSSAKSLPLYATCEDLSDEAALAIPRSNGARSRAETSAKSVEHISHDGMHDLRDSEWSPKIGSSPTTPTVPSAISARATLRSDVEIGLRSHSSSRTVSTPVLRRRLSASKKTSSSKASLSSSSKPRKIIPTPLQFKDSTAASRLSAVTDPQPSPIPSSIPLPPLSLPTYLQLELSAQRPSPLYIHRSKTSDFPYESSRVKIERLQNFLFLPPQLEQVLWFGALACLDAWLFSFTILPLRFIRALFILGRSWGHQLMVEIRFIGGFIYAGSGRVWQRERLRQESLNMSTTPKSSEQPSAIVNNSDGPPTPKSIDKERASAKQEPNRKRRRTSISKHRRSKSMPSTLLPDHKADILKGLLILLSCTILMYFDASRMYHGIRGQAAIKLYVIYNVLEVCDRLFSALGQDVLECLFSKETLERKPDGRSKILRPFWLFLLALCYCLIHATALFYQVITLNVAVNSYSNALLTLLMSNQFVEIKSTVFKKIEKENLFQLTCADIVERFQLWLMLMIIASRNIIETGGLTLSSSSASSSSSSPYVSASILPKSFTIFPDWAGTIMGPFLLVLGSEMLVDWLKHAYITKFNNTKPAIYGRFLDVLAKDYYSNAFAEPNLTRRIGLPVIPLACLFIRASVQTYHMFLATYMPVQLPSPATSLSVDKPPISSPETTAAIQHIDHIFRRALGGSAFGAGATAYTTANTWTTDDLIAFATMAIAFLVLYLTLLAFKLVLGMCLLSFARHRYRDLKKREGESVHAEGRRVGGWGVVEVDDDKRRWIYRDDIEGARRLKEREREAKAKEEENDFAGVERWKMVGKRIW